MGEPRGLNLILSIRSRSSAGLAGVPFDLIARAIAEKLSVRLKQTCLVEDRPGAAGNLGAEAVARSEADGHTLLISLNTTFTVNPSLYKTLPFDPNADFRFLTITASGANYLVVHPSVAVNSVAEFVIYAKNSRSAMPTAARVRQATYA